MTPPETLNLQEMAFVRAWAEGLDTATAWARYRRLEGPGDARQARGDLLRLRERLSAQARSLGRPDLAALLRRDPQAIAEGSARAPSLEAFGACLPEDFYSERELLELYQATHGRAAAASPQRRRQRLRERLLEALRWLQAQPSLTDGTLGSATASPQAHDGVGQWLDERLAKRLEAAGVQRLETLVALIRVRGYHWYRQVPRLGPVGAARIVQWLERHAGSLGALGEAVLRPPGELDPAALTPAPQTGIVPIERLVLPAGLDGAGGSNRAPIERCKLKADNDLQAVHAWLRLRPQDTHTWRAYRKEAERFLLWAVLAQGRALSSLDGDDCIGFRDFLAAPPGQWCAPRHIQRWSTQWRPFEGPLSPASAATAVTIVRSMCEWLVRRHYLDSNPWDAVPLRPDAPTAPRLRALTHRQWTWVERWLGEPALHGAPPQSPAEASRHARPHLQHRVDAANERLRFLVRLAYTTGLRLAELADARLGRIQEERLDDGEPGWSLQVLGKRARWREVPLPAVTVQALQRHLASRGLALHPGANPPDTPLVARLDGRSPLSAGRIYEILVDAFSRCAQWVEPQDAACAARIREATTHWLRHTYGSHGVARGMPQDVLQANLGHRSLATTSIYVTAEKTRRHAAVRGAFDVA